MCAPVRSVCTVYKYHDCVRVCVSVYMYVMWCFSLQCVQSKGDVHFHEEVLSLADTHVAEILTTCGIGVQSSVWLQALRRQCICVKASSLLTTTGVCVCATAVTCMHTCDVM